MVIDITKPHYRTELYIRAKTIPNSDTSDIFKAILTLCGKETVIVNDPNAGFFSIKLDETVNENWNKYPTDGVFSSSTVCPITKYELCSTQQCSFPPDASAIRLTTNLTIEVNSALKIA